MPGSNLVAFLWVAGLASRGGTPIYELYRYVPLRRVWFSASLLSNRV